MWIRTLYHIVDMTEKDNIKVVFDKNNEFTVVLYKKIFGPDNVYESYDLCFFKEREQASKFLEKLFREFKRETVCIDIPLLISQL